MEIKKIETIEEAINYMKVKHQGQLRKGTKIPFETHPMRVYEILLENEINDLDVLMAGLLHDVVEDTETSLEEINTLFNEQVAGIVSDLTENKDYGWDHRKLYAINHVKELSVKSKFVKLADAISNLESMKAEESIDWSKFNKGFQHQKWYYHRLVYELVKEDKINKSFKNYSLGLVEDVFGEITGIIPEIFNEDTLIWGEGMTKAGYIYRCEYWNVDWINMFTYYFDRAAITSNQTEDVVRFLEDNHLVEFDEVQEVSLFSKDDLGNEIIVVNLVVGDEDVLYCKPIPQIAAKVL